MTPTSDERREVAEMLREDANCSENSPRFVVESYLGIEYDGTDLLEESYKSESLLHIADLIDPTCEVVGSEPLYIDDETEFILSCGHVAEMTTNEPPAYCPECGARVTGGDGR